MDYLPLVFDGILILIFAACIIEGRRRGFVRTVLSLVSVIISLFVAQSFSAPVAAWANEEFAGEAVSGYVENYIENAFENEGTQLDSSDVLGGSVPEEVTAMLEKYGVSVSEIADGASQGIEELSNAIAQRILDAVLFPVLEIIAFLVIYIVCSFVLSLLNGFICSAFNLPVIKQMNKLLGGILGAVKGVGVASVLSVFAVTFSKIAAGNEIADAVSQSALINAVGTAVIQIIQGG
ncbi:MAG: CvpA family protein [Clostridia bacterium]|nr:CvpA family protein [Clostridia bacterium]